MQAKSEDTKKPSTLLLALVAVYVMIVLLVDTLAALEVHEPIDWRMFRWTSLNGFDWFKFLAWFVVPFTISLPRLDWEYLGFNRWQRWDWLLLIALGVLGLLAVLSILLIPGLRDYYPSLSQRTWSDKWADAGRGMLWVTSWLLGWEFLHRYFLLRPFAARWPRFGWLVVPFSEGVYHVQKHPAEMAAMVGVSMVLTLWTLRRRNAMLPFLTHLIVEVELILFLVLV
jgi:hypothetical protein